MYGLVLMVAMTGGADVPAQCFGCFGGHGCHGCFGGHGCHGCFGGFGRHGCHGCHGCFGGHGCHGCFGGHGCHGCFGGHGCHGCFGGHGCHGCFGFRHGCHGCHGYYGCHGCYGYGCYGYSCGGYVSNGCCGYAADCCGAAPAAVEKKQDQNKGNKQDQQNKGQEQVSAPARIIVTLPANAKLTIQGAPTTSMSSTRTFISPKLEAGATYKYKLVARFTQNGKPVIVKKIAKVSAGQETRVTIAAPETVASK